MVSSPFFTVMVGLVEKPPWKRDACEEPVWQWAEETYQENIAAVSGWWELCQWDDEGPRQARCMCAGRTRRAGAPRAVCLRRQ